MKKEERRDKNQKLGIRNYVKDRVLKWETTCGKGGWLAYRHSHRQEAAPLTVLPVGVKPRVYPASTECISLICSDINDEMTQLLYTAWMFAFKKI